jgi:hypothetical protein
MKKVYLLGLLAAGLLSGKLLAQGVGVGTETPNANAVLDVSSTTKGFLPPRMTSGQRTSIPNTQGMLVYDITENSYYYNTGAAWVKLGGGSSLPAGQNPGDLLYWNGSAWTVLPVGQNGQTLRICNGVLTWNPVCLPPGIVLTSSPKTFNFDGVGAPLPDGVTIHTGATASAVGTAATYNNGTNFHWGTATAGAKSFASATGLDASTDSATQSVAVNRAIGVRQTGAFGDPGAAIVFSLENTTGKTNFQMSFKLQSLDITSPRTVTWTVDYGFGDAPTSFTAATPVGTMTTGSSSFTNNDVTVNFGSALDNKSSRVWVRIVTLSTSVTTGNRPSSAVDDVSFSWQ